MPPFLRLGCAGVAVIAIAALTSIGLFAVVAGGLPFAGPGARTVANGAPVLVTIQAQPVTPTVAPQPTATEAPQSLIPAFAAPARAAQSATQPPAAVAATVTPPSSPVALASPRTDAASATSPGIHEHAAAHDGLTMEVAEVDRHWRPVSADAATPSARDAPDVLTVHVRFTNRTGEVRFVADTDVLLVGDDGARFSPRQSGAHREPRVLTVPVAPNDTLRGWLTYELPPSTSLRGLQWSPTRPDRPRADATYMIGLPR